MPSLRALFLVGAALVVAAAGIATASHSLAAPGRAGKSLVIKEISNQYHFTPGKVTVHKGTVVTWQNKSDAPHTITGTSKNWKFASKSIAHGGKVTLTFSKAGTYKYYCTIHPYMKGTIVVK